MKHIFFSILNLTFFLAVAQEENPIEAFEDLMEKTWAIESEWGDGTIFKQELTVEYGLNRTIIISKTKGFTDPDRTQFGNRSYGIRQYNEESGEIRFWEWDTFGGLTEGRVVVDGRDFLFIYNYQDMKFVDIWEYLDDETYSFKVMSYENDEFGDLYLKGAYKSKN